MLGDLHQDFSLSRFAIFILESLLLGVALCKLYLFRKFAFRSCFMLFRKLLFLVKVKVVLFAL